MFTVEADDGNAVGWIQIIRRFNHIVLLVAAHAMLWAECSAYVNTALNQIIQGVLQVASYRCGMGHQRDLPRV